MVAVVRVSQTDPRPPLRADAGIVDPNNGQAPIRATNAYIPGISGPSGGKGLVGGTPIPGGRSGPGGLQGPDGGVGDGDVGSACAMPIASPTALKPTPPATTAMATSCLSFSAHLSGLICVDLGVIIGTPGEMSLAGQAGQDPKNSGVVVI